jgi:hypothetical protein
MMAWRCRGEGRGRFLAKMGLNRSYGGKVLRNRTALDQQFFQF